MSPILWIFLGFVLLVFSFGITWIIGMLIHFFHKKKIKKKALDHQDEFNKKIQIPIIIEKEVEDEFRTNQRFREFEKLRRLATKDKTNGESISSNPGTRELQDSRILRDEYASDTRADKKVIKLPE